MEEKVYSRSVNKTSLAARVVDRKAPKRNFTQQELSDIMALDNWVQCDKCEKWRMLPPTLSQAEVDALPDVWYCKMNVYDPTRASCRAKERDGKFMTLFYQNEAMKVNDPSLSQQAQPTQELTGSKEPLLSQLSQTSNVSTGSGGEFAPHESIRDSVDSKMRGDDHAINTERDEILTGLLQVQAPSGRTGAIDNHSANAKQLITKYYFHDSLLEETNAHPPTGVREA